MVIVLASFIVGLLFALWGVVLGAYGTVLLLEHYDPDPLGLVVVLISVTGSVLSAAVGACLGVGSFYGMETLLGLVVGG